MNLAEKNFLEYITFDTQSNEVSGTHPSSSGQLVFAHRLEQELNALGCRQVTVSAQGYVTASLPATPGYEQCAVLGLIAHLDTSDAASGRNVHAQILRYEGGLIPLGQSGKVLDPAVFPELNRVRGHRLAVTDGTTLLGADDKAGIAAIMAALESVIRDHAPHGDIRVAFTPDEELGEGTLFFPLEHWGADYAFTADGGAVCRIEYQNFNAASAVVHFHGVSVHPGSAKGIMVNAVRTAAEFDALLPALDIPRETDGFQGFYHLTDLHGNVSEAESKYLLRDHDAHSFEHRKQVLRDVAGQLNRKYGADTVTVSIRDQYRNMAEIIDRVPFLLDIARKAVWKAGLEPEIVPIRGGTDGAALSFRGLPCPNLGTGGYNYHGEYEYLSLTELEQAVTVLRSVIQSFADGEAPRPR